MVMISIANVERVSSYIYLNATLTPCRLYIRCSRVECSHLSRNRDNKHLILLLSHIPFLVLRTTRGFLLFLFFFFHSLLQLMLLLLLLFFLEYQLHLSRLLFFSRIVFFSSFALWYIWTHENWSFIEVRRYIYMCVCAYKTNRQPIGCTPRERGNRILKVAIYELAALCERLIATKTNCHDEACTSLYVRATDLLLARKWCSWDLMFACRKYVR